ncbi:hypothetical protein M8J77_000997 [Diaphorina citri]|nr:hypothetical protein M8J77_000997 [Diaphorina citri]
MSSKNSSESMIAERRLRPIYDLLDFNNNKKAIQEADRVLKKSPDLDCAKVLKSLALLRLGRDADAEQLLETVAKRAPCDDPTLQAMTICYRELRLPDKICNIYEEAVKKDPTNEELLTHLFMSYVRVYNYKKQQHTAMSLYKLKSKNPYYFWAVMSIVMQASKTEDNISKSITLPLAERMVKKFIDENRIDAEQEVQLYVIILEMQQKYQEVLDLLASPLGNMLQSYYTASQKKIDTLIAMKQWDQVNLYLKQELIVSDSWHNYVNYLTSVFHLVSTGSAIVPNDVTNSVNVPNDVTNRANVPNDSANVPNDVITSADLSFESCAQYLSILEEKKVALSHKSRAVHLVRLEFYVKLREHEKEIAANTNSTRSLPLADSVLGASLVDLLLSYYKMFGHTPCCLKDLQKYLAHLSPEEVNVFSDALWKMNNIEGKEEYVPTDRKSMLQFISCLQFNSLTGRLMNNIEGKEEYVPTDRKSMLQFISCLQFNRYLGKYDNASLSVEAKISLIIRLTQTYYLCDAYTTDQAPAEIKANDAIILLVIYLLHDLYVLDSKYIHYILIYIHYVSTRNHYNFNLELLALHYYHRIGECIVCVGLYLYVLDIHYILIYIH